MKRSILMSLVIAASVLFFGCEEMDPLVPDLEQPDQEIASLKCAKAGKTFEGLCTPVEMTAEINKWYDAMDDWRVTGTTIWVTAEDGFYGTAELFVDAKNPHDENSGKWEITWIGSMTPSADGLSTLIVAEAFGNGVEGKVRGMKATWTYSMDYDGTPETFFYVVEGSIEKNQGHRNLRKRRH